MFRKLFELKHFDLQALDKTLGHCRDFLLDDRDWVVRYMVADTNRWLPFLGKKVLISPISVGEPNWDERQIPVNLSSKMIKDCPALDEHAPVSREYEKEFFRHYGYGHYWTGVNTWGAYPYPTQLVDPSESAARKEDIEQSNHLRSVAELHGYDVRAGDQTIGKLDDYLFLSADWRVTYLVVKADSRLDIELPLLIPVESVREIHWDEHAIDVNVKADQLQKYTVDAGEPFTEPA